MANSTSAPLRVGVSACLLGQQVRFDGGHKRNSFVADQVGSWVEFVPVCPEMGIGLGTPRETIRLARVDGEVRLVAPKSGTDLTERMREYCRRKVDQLATESLVGFVLKSGSPTCGMERVRIYDHNGMPSKIGEGLFVSELRRRLPGLPLEEEGRLHDPRLRENFFERVFGYHRVATFFAPAEGSKEWTRSDLVQFHAREKLLLKAHDPTHARELGKLVAAAGEFNREDLAQQYQALFLRCLATPVTAKRHFNVLQRMLGYFKSAPSHDRITLKGILEDFRAGLIPLVVPITMIRHMVERHHLEYLATQTYLDPHPKELMLRNH